MRVAGTAPQRAAGTRADQLLANLVNVVCFSDHLVPSAQELPKMLGQLLQRNVGFLD